MERLRLFDIAFIQPVNASSLFDPVFAAYSSKGMLTSIFCAVAAGPGGAPGKRARIDLHRQAGFALPPDLLSRTAN